MAKITAADGTVYDEDSLVKDADGYWAQMGGAFALIKPSAEYDARRAADTAASIVAQAAQEAATKASLDALALPLVQAVEAVLTARQLPPMNAAEKASVRDGAVYLASRGEHGKKG